LQCSIPYFFLRRHRVGLIYAGYIRSLLEGLRAGKHTPDILLFDLLQGDPGRRILSGNRGGQIFWKAFDADTLFLTEKVARSTTFRNSMRFLGQWYCYRLRAFSASGVKPRKI